MLTVFLDSISMNAVYNEKQNLIKDLLSRDPSLFKIFRTNCDIDKEEIKKIPSKPKIEKSEFNQIDLNTIYQKLLFQPKNPCQEQFFFSFLKYARQTNNPNYIYESVYVSENPIFFEKFLHWGMKENCLRDFFPNLILLNLERLKEVMDYYEIKNEQYYFDHFKLKLQEEWFFKKLFSSIPELSRALAKYHQNENMVRFLRSLGFRFRKLFYCINCIGIEHYFGSLKKTPIDFEVASKAVPLLTKDSVSISDLEGFIDPDNLFILFYHAEYLISLVTGIFDNLALLAKERYGIIQDIIRVSLSNEEFLEKVETVNVDIKKHVDQYRDFINLIYEFRDKVIHGEGLSQLVSPVVINWSSFIKITPEISYYIKRCRDDKSEYKFISKWGVFERELDLILDPYFFSKQALDTIIKFANENLQKLN